MKRRKNDIKGNARKRVRPNQNVYNCEHFEKLLKSGVVKNFLEVFYQHTKPGTTKTGGQIACFSCDDSQRNPFKAHYLCTSCVFIGCKHAKHLRDHMRQTGHLVGFDIAIEEFYCFQCGDVVISDEVEKLKTSIAFSCSVPISHIGSPKPTKETKRTKRLSNYGLDEGLHGIVNLGNTCYVSVILQCMAHNPLLRNFFLSDGHCPKKCHLARNGSRNHKMCHLCLMHDLLQKMYSDDPTPITTENFIWASWKQHSHLKGYSQKDAHEYLMALRSSLHECFPNYTDSKNCPCLIHSLFSSEERSDITCKKCGMRSSRTTEMEELSLDMDFAKSVFNRNSMEESLEPAKSLSDCLDSFTKAEKLEQYKCSGCGERGFCEKQLSFEKLPLVLTLQLKRFRQENKKQDIKISDFIDFPLRDLDLSMYLQEKEAGGKTLRRNGFHSHQKQQMYDLFAIVEHRGKNLGSGHYISYVQKNGSWYVCDDQHVRLVSSETVRNVQAYILFYIKRNIPPEESSAFTVR